MGNFPTTIWSYYCIVVRVRDSPEDVDGFGNLFPVLSHPDAGGFGNLFPILSHPKCSSHVFQLKANPNTHKRTTKVARSGLRFDFIERISLKQTNKLTQTRSFSFCVAIRSSISEDPAFHISILRTHHVDFSSPCVACPPIQSIILIMARISCLLCYC